MRYYFLDGVKKPRKTIRRLLVIVPIVGLLVGAYLLIDSLAPNLPIDGKSADATAQKLVTEKPGMNGNRLYVPQINIDVAVVEGTDVSTVEKGAWHRQPQNGNPEEGGNFVLSAHRFNLGLTPQQTRATSPFFHIGELQNGDQIFVDWGAKRYAYKVTRKYDVPRTATEIEARSDDAKLTLYSCDWRGEAAGRYVVEAKPIGTVAWVEGQKPVVETNPNAD